MKKSLLLIGFVLLLSACIPSVHPFYFEKDVISEPRLSGEWQPTEEGEEKNTWKFEQGKGKTLVVTVREEGKTGTFTGHLFKLGKEFYLDLAAKEAAFDPGQADMVGASLIRGHLLCSVKMDESKIQIAFFEFDWLEKHLKEKPTSLAHIRDEQIVLTAGTAELQKFVLKHRKELFGEVREFKKKDAAAEEPKK